MRMTEKRYTTMWKPETTFSRFWIVRENWERKLNANDVVDLLNEQHETILSLHKTIEELDNCQKGQSHRINDLYLENKQLKDLITHLGYTIKYDGYRHISLELQE